MKVGHGTTSCTADLQSAVLEKDFRFPSLKNYCVVILDTPGLDDLHVENVDTLGRIAHWLTT